MLHVVSVSLGSATRDTDQVVELLGREVHIERRGTGGDLRAAAAIMAELDGRVDAIGLGGIDLYVQVRDRRYTFKDALRLKRMAPNTPVVCGSGLKNSLERMAVRALDPTVKWQGRKVLMVSAVDRFGMAEELSLRGADLLFGDMAFALGLPVPVRSIRTLDALARTLLPVLVRLPFRWLYPVGAAQERAPSGGRFDRYYEWAEVVAGDWHYIKRHAPARLDGKTILTNTTTAEDVAFLAGRGAARLVTTTPRFAGRSVGTNLLEAAFVALEGAEGELPSERYAALVEQAGIVPTALDLAPEGAHPSAPV